MYQIVLLQFRVTPSDKQSQATDCTLQRLTTPLNRLNEVCGEGEDVKFCTTLRLHRRCEYAQFVFFASHFADWKRYRALVQSTLEEALNRTSLVSDFPSQSVIPIQLVIFLSITSCDIFTPIDPCWSSKILKWAILRMEIEEALSWLSTLGGAYSSLGDRNINFAKKAGQISMSQLRLSLVFGDPNLVARCFIYMCHSLCQQGYRKKAILFIKKCLYPRLVQMDGHLERIVSQMYKSLCYRIKFIYK